MKCPHCGAVQKGSGAFCTSCGLRLPKHGLGLRLRSALKKARCTVTRVLGEQFRRIPFKIRLIGGFALGFVLVAALFLIRLLPSATTAALTSTRFWWDEASGSTAVVMGTTPLASRLPGKVDDSQFSMTGETGAVLLADGSLYLLSDGGVSLAASSVADFALSVDGEAVVYRTGSGVLSLTRNGRAKTVAEEDVSARYVLSPDGKTVAYARESDGVICLWKSGKTTRTSYRGTPVAVSDGGSYLYHFHTENGKECFSVNDRLLTASAATSRFSLTRNGSACAFVADSDEGWLLYLTEKGGEAKLLAAVESGKAAPQPVSREIGAVSRTAGSLQAVYIGCDSFRSLYIRAYDTLFFVTETGELREIDRVDRRAGLCAVGERAWFVRASTGELVTVTADRPEAQTVATDVRSFGVTESGRLFWLGEDGALYYAGGTGSGRKTLSQNVISLAVIGERCVFENSDGFLYTCRRGGKCELVKEDIDTVVSRPGAVDYELVRSGTRAVYSSADGKTFAAVMP